MDATRTSLLLRARSGSPRAWEQLVELYRPMIYAWFRRHGVEHHDAEELGQDVLSVVVRKLEGFTHSGRTGAFRAWLRAITANRCKEFWRAGKLRPRAGMTDFEQHADALQDPESQLSRQWDEEHDRYVLSQLLRAIEAEFEPKTLQAFQWIVFEGMAASDAAERLDMTRDAVYAAKARVLRKLRLEADGLVDPIDG